MQARLIDHLSLDQREFPISQHDIEQICRFFGLGKLKSYEKEKNITVSHSNFFVFAATSLGAYALKFYPPQTKTTLAMEYAINRRLISHHFPTPLMYAGQAGQPFLETAGRLATCYDYVAGAPAWQHIKKPKAFTQINKSLLLVKKILPNFSAPMTRLQTISMRVTSLKRSLINVSHEDKRMIEKILLDVCQSYQRHQPLFTSQWLHHNANLTNFLILKNKTYMLDLSHIQENYVLSDLASLVVSCLFFDVPLLTIKNITKNYFLQHKLKTQYASVLNTLIKVSLIKEYLKNNRREQSMGPYKHLASERKKVILDFLFSIQRPSII